MSPGVALPTSVCVLIYKTGAILNVAYLVSHSVGDIREAIKDKAHRHQGGVKLDTEKHAHVVCGMRVHAHVCMRVKCSFPLVFEDYNKPGHPC